MPDGNYDNNRFLSFIPKFTLGTGALIKASSVLCGNVEPLPLTVPASLNWQLQQTSSGTLSASDLTYFVGNRAAGWVPRN